MNRRHGPRRHPHDQSPTSVELSDSRLFATPADNDLVDAEK